jgi:hypothetical protein
MANLRLIASNTRPIREEKHPRTWLLHTDKKNVEVHISHDSLDRPVVVSKVVA